MKNIRITMPGSKSYTNRALLIASLTKSSVKIINPLICDDTKAMINCLQKLGVKILIKNNLIEVTGGLKQLKKSCNLNANLSGTTLRFILALSAVTAGTKTISGKKGLNARPIKELVYALEQMGARITYLQKIGFPPIKVVPAKTVKNEVTIDGGVSSQFLSALLMIAPIVGGIKIKVLGKQISKPYIDMTADLMNRFGVKVINNNYKSYQVSEQKYVTTDYLVEGDFSSASYFLAAAALNNLTVTLQDLNPNTKQADIKLLEILKEMGSKICLGGNQVIITGKGVRSINVDMEDCPDQIPAVAVLVAFAPGISKISGISSLRIKETDRVFALRQELKKMGIQTLASKNILTIWGGYPKAVSIKTYGDHRMAMAFAVASSKLSGMKILNPEVVNKTFPDFWQRFNVLKNRNIVLIGMRGSGKSTVAKILSKKLNKKYLEIDLLIEEKVGVSISEIVQKFGWDFFRQEESKVLQKIALQENMIISAGGGVILQENNIKTLQKTGILIWLKASVPTLMQRVKNRFRPALTNYKDQQTEIAEVLKTRKKLYKRAADLIISCDNQTAEETAEKIIKEINLC